MDDIRTHQELKSLGAGYPPAPPRPLFDTSMSNVARTPCAPLWMGLGVPYLDRG